MTITKHIALYTFIIASLILNTSTVLAQDAPRQQEDVFERGIILKILDEQVVEEYGVQYFRQTPKVEILTGKHAGKVTDLVYEIEATHMSTQGLNADDRVVVGVQTIEGEQPTFYISDIYRLHGIMWILGLFLLITFLLARKKGLRSFAGLALSFVIIFTFIIPQILDGQNPIWISFAGALLIALTTIYVAHGVSARTSIALTSTVITIVLSFVLANLFIQWAKLFGIGTEEAFYLQFANDIAINLQGLLLGGIVLGVLGVLDDITIAQTAAVEELKRANKKLSARELYTRGIRIGQEHIVALINTLALAYTGASFPLLLLLHIYERPLWLTLNSEIIVEEMIRILVGSIALMLAVPITTALAAWHYGKK